jgi:hypothetical protein
MDTLYLVFKHRVFIFTPTRGKEVILLGKHPLSSADEKTFQILLETLADMSEQLIIL